MIGSSSASKYAPRKMSELSTLPEGASLLCRFQFTFIGPGAHEVARKVSEAELHAEVCEVVAEWGLPQGKASEPAAENEGQQQQEGQSRRSSVVAAESMQSHLSLRGTDRGTFCMLNEDRLEVARVSFRLVESFQESVGKLADENDVRNNCYIFLCDTRLNVQQDVLSTVLRGLAEVRFNYNQVKQRSASWRLPEPRAVVLLHAQGAGGEWRNGPEGDPVVKGIVDRVAEVTASSPLCGVLGTDFASSDALYATVQALARDLYRANTRSPGRNTRGSLGSGGPGHSTRFCAVQ